MGSLDNGIVRRYGSTRLHQLWATETSSTNYTQICLESLKQNENRMKAEELWSLAPRFNGWPRLPLDDFLKRFIVLRMLISTSASTILRAIATCWIEAPRYSPPVGKWIVQCVLSRVSHTYASLMAWLCQNLVYSVMRLPSISPSWKVVFVVKVCLCRKQGCPDLPVVSKRLDAKSALHLYKKMRHVRVLSVLVSGNRWKNSIVGV